MFPASFRFPVPSSSIVQHLPDGAYAVQVWNTEQALRDEVVPNDLPDADIVPSSDSEDDSDGPLPPHTGQRRYWRIWFKEAHKRDQYLLQTVKQYAGCSATVIAGPIEGFPDLWRSVKDLEFINYVYAEVPWRPIRERLIEYALQEWPAPAKSGIFHSQLDAQRHRKRLFVHQNTFRRQALFSYPFVVDMTAPNAPWLLESAPMLIRRIAGEHNTGEHLQHPRPATVYSFTPAYLKDLMLQPRHLSLTEVEHVLLVKMVLMLWILASHYRDLKLDLMQGRIYTYRRILWYVAACVRRSSELGDEEVSVTSADSMGANAETEGITIKRSGSYALCLYDDMHMPPAASYESWWDYFCRVGAAAALAFNSDET